MKLYTQDLIAFRTLVEYLLPPSIDLEGCEILFPESVFFGGDTHIQEKKEDREDPMNGKPIFIAKTDKDGKMISITQQSKLGLGDIRQKFSVLVRERKADTKNVYQFLMEKKQNNESMASSPTTQIKKAQTTNKLEESPLAVEKDKDKIHYQDAVILRHKEKEEGVRVLTDNQFIETFQKRPNDPFWGRVECI